jgi:hypothetical protein
MDWEQMQKESISRGYWASAEEINDTLKERQKTKRRDSLVILGVVCAGLAFLLGLIFLLI